MLKLFPAIIIVVSSTITFGQNISTKIISVDTGWAGNSINTVVFRKNSLCTFKKTQYISYYNNNGFVVLGMRQLHSSEWQLATTNFKGNIADAHNSISIMVDGNGYLHLAWNHHNNKLHYAKSIAQGSLQMTAEIAMTGVAETNITYPEFYSMLDGKLLFLYRDGASGEGNLVINTYDPATQQWNNLHKNLINGEGERNAYWQACVDKKGTIHLSWVWRETADVASNHDLCYAKSTDGGITWQTSGNKKYDLPITAATAEYVCCIPQESELINQTSMCGTNDGDVLIASYWKEKNETIPQYHVAFFNATRWQVVNTRFRKTAFSLSGGGTKRIPISRPQIISYKNKTVLIFRDEERGSKVSVAMCSNLGKNKWMVEDLSKTPVGSWEPTYDTELWKQKKQLHLFVQLTDQKDAEGSSDHPPSPVQVMEVKFNN